MLCVRCPGTLGACSAVCSVGALCCVSAVLGPLAPAHRCARSLRCVACAASWVTWLLFTGGLAQCVVRCVACAVSWGTWLLFTGVPSRCVVLCVRCPRPPSSCSLLCSLGALCCVCDVQGHLVSVHWCARSVCCVACAGFFVTWLLFTDVLARWVVWCVRCPAWLVQYSTCNVLYRSDTVL